MSLALNNWALITCSSECMPEAYGKSQPVFHCLSHHNLRIFTHLYMNFLIFQQKMYIPKFQLTIIITLSNIQSNFNGSNTDGLFTMAYSNSFLSLYGIFSDSSRKQILREIFIFYDEIVCCVYSLDSPH